MVCKKNTFDLYWFGLRSALRPVGEGNFVLSCTEVLVPGVISGRERGRSSQVSRSEWRKWVCATLLVTSQGPGESSAHVLCLCCYGGSFSSFFVFGWVVLGLLRMIPACSLYSLKKVQGYMMLVCGVTLSRGLGRALSGGDVVCTVKAWRRYFWYCCYVSGMGTTIEGVVPVFRCCSDAPCHSWSYSQRGVFVLVV
jgi:hypothetical protein